MTLNEGGFVDLAVKVFLLLSYLIKEFYRIYLQVRHNTFKA